MLNTHKEQLLLEHMKPKSKSNKNLTMTREALVSLIIERVETILKEQGLTQEPGIGDGFGNPQSPFDGMDNPGGEDPAMTDQDGLPAGENPSAEADSLLTMDDLEQMEQPDARKTLMAGLQGGGKEQQTTADLVAAILGDTTKAQQDGLNIDPAALPASPELKQTAADVAAISGLSLQEYASLKDMFKSYLSEKKKST